MTRDPHMVYQAKVDGRPIGPTHDNWRDAAADLVNNGYATWSNGGIKHSPESLGSEVARWLSSTVET